MELDCVEVLVTELLLGCKVLDWEELVLILVEVKLDCVEEVVLEVS